MTHQDFQRRLNLMLEAIRIAIGHGDDHHEICSDIAEAFLSDESFFPIWLSRIVEGEIQDYHNREGHWAKP